MVSALVVLVYIFLGGLASAIYNEVLQFFLIVAGFLPLVWLGLKDVGGWSGLKATTVRRLTPMPGRAWAAPTPTRWESNGLAWRWAWALCSRLAIGAPTFWWCSGPWPRTP